MSKRVSSYSIRRRDPLASRRSGGTKQDRPKPDSGVGKVYDLFKTNKGKAVKLGGQTSKTVTYLRDEYLMQIVSLGKNMYIYRGDY